MSFIQFFSKIIYRKSILTRIDIQQSQETVESQSNNISVSVIDDSNDNDKVNSFSR